MKRGPKSGYYEDRLRTEFQGKLPRCTKNMRVKNPREASRRMAMRALHRRIHDKPKYSKLAKWVRGIRTGLGVSRVRFAHMLGVSVITLKRWELGLGHSPSTLPRKNAHGRKIPSNMKRLQQLEALVENLKKSGTPFEEKS